MEHKEKGLYNVTNSKASDHHIQAVFGHDSRGVPVRASRSYSVPVRASNLQFAPYFTNGSWDIRNMLMMTSDIFRSTYIWSTHNRPLKKKFPSKQAVENGIPPNNLYGAEAKYYRL
ncbi:hypothetical protein Y032_0239g3325 [Ancylostoma ceylanicum]|uniref:Uncharacterized protein n=1 Tax=Ancylostoma ceylanicum TaxID=53326 RepID=A0A016SF05_9BILA|nr:hypothetical protein Y032_0239g3325 [Ancylostoma ceylanicum]